MSYDLRPKSGQVDLSFGEQRTDLQLINQTTADTQLSVKS